MMNQSLLFNYNDTDIVFQYPYLCQSLHLLLFLSR